MRNTPQMSMLIRALRDWRLREVRLLFVALSVAVLSVTSISFFTDRVERAMRMQGTALLGADLVINSSRPVSERLSQLASPFKTASVVEFRSVMLSGDNSLLTEVKAVSHNFPLRGALETSDSLEQLTGTRHPGVPPAGEAWAAPEVFYRLDLSPGASIQLGNSEFTLSRVINFEMDAGGSVFRFAPRLMINVDDLPETGLITPASRATYKLLLAGEEAQMHSLKAPLRVALEPWEMLQTVDEGRPEISAALDRAVRFMKLASVLTIIIAGAAVALAVLSYTARETHSIAILKTLGATRSILWREYALRFALLVLSATLAGALFGYAAQLFLSHLLSGLLNIALPPASFRPLGAGLLTAMLTLAGFALPSILAVIRTPPMHIMRATQSDTAKYGSLSIVTISLTMGGFLIWQAGEFKLAGLIFVGVAAGLGLMLLIAWLITRVFRHFRVYQGHGWQLGLANIGRYGGRAALLISTIGIGIFALSLLGGVREGLITAWQNRIPDDAPNHFLINIQPGELAKIDVFFEQRDLKGYQLYPMIRGRLRAINGQEVGADDFETTQAKNTLKRELNLTATRSLPNENTIVSGRWFDAQAKKTTENEGISVEAEIAARLGVGLGDTLTFDIGGQTFTQPISSLRKVKWDTMQPNFYVISAPDTLNDYPTSYITAVQILDADTRFTTDLISKFPGVTVLDVRAILTQLQRIVAQVSSAVEVVFAFSLLAGIVVLLAAIQTQRNDRRQEIAILKTLGASQRQIKRSVAVEFVMLGALAGLLGAGLALLTGWVLAEHIFDLSYQISWPTLFWGMLAGIIGLGGVAYSVIRQLIQTPPTRLLQEL